MKTFDIVRKGILFETITKATKFADVVPPGWMLIGFYTKNHTAAAAQVSFGYTDHGITVATSVVATASITVYTAVAKPNYGSTAQSIYVNTNGAASDTFNACTLDVTFVIEQYNPKY